MICMACLRDYTECDCDPEDDSEPGSLFDARPNEDDEQEESEDE